MKNIYSIIAFLLLSNTVVISSPIDGLKFGKYSVGFHVQEHFDHSRRSRSIEIYTWYPAYIKSTDRQTTISDYLKDHFKKKGSKKDWEAILNKKTNSFIEAININGSFPIVILGQGYHFESAASLVILAEYIASYGYIVSTCNLKGTKQQSVNLDLADLETQIKDMEFVLSKALENNQTIVSVGVIGFDLGGLSSALLSMKNTKIKCMVSLDGGLIFRHNLNYIKQSQYYNPRQLKIPVFQITRTTLGNNRMGINEDFSLFKNSVFSKKYLLRFENIKHQEFTSFNLMGIENYGSDKISIYEGEVHDAIPDLHNYVLRFMDAFLKNDRLSLAYLNKPISSHNFSSKATLEVFESKLKEENN